MSKTEKLIEKMRRQPNGIRLEEAEKVLKTYGYELVRQKGSPLKKAYIIDILFRIDNKF